MKTPSSKEAVLLVDDEADIRAVLEISLSDMGYAVLAAENGRQALEMFKNNLPALVLTDIKMPGMDGIELLRRIKAENPETEVVMITGHGDMDLAIESLKNKATDFITKPINVDALEVALKRACEKIRIRQKLQEYTENLERLVQEKTQLQDHLSSLGLMIGSISHGIKGLLTGLDGGIYLVESGFKKKDPDQIGEGWEIVKSMVERIRKMVLDILFYAKERDIEWETIDPVVFAADVAKTMESKAKNHAIEFKRELNLPDSTLEMDVAHVHAALVNILENAVDACVKDTSKTVHRITFRLGQDRKHIRFVIADTGIGMDPETKAKVFTLFYSSKGRKGTGLGLFIAKSVIEQHGGSIHVHSAPGKGSEFIVSIPRKAF